MVPDLPASLVDQLAARRCALFLGPDISESYGGYAGLPTTWEIAGKLADACGYRGRYRPLARMAQIYAHQFGDQCLNTFLAERLSDAEHPPLPLHEILARLPVPVIIHAGWDCLLERALDGRSMPYQVVRTALDVGFIEDGCTLYKPYGSIDRPDTLAVTEGQQFALLSRTDGLATGLRHTIDRYSLLMLGYALDRDSVLVQLYHQQRRAQQGLGPADFCVQALDRAEDAGYWEALGVRLIVADPTRFAHDLARAVARAQGRAVELPDLDQISTARPATVADLETLTSSVNNALGTLGVSDLVDKSDVPLLNAEQMRDLEAMRAAYERLAEKLGDPAGSASMWLRQGNVEYVRGNYDTAGRYYRRALDAQPDLAEAYHNLHYVHLAAAGQWTAAGDDTLAAPLLEQALDAYRRAVELKPFLALLPPRYQVEGVLGQGGIGVVYLARDTQTGQQVAVKLLNRAHMYSEKATVRFQREALLLQRLHHPHIVRLLDSGHYEGRQFIVLEYLGRQSLDRLLRVQGRLPLDQAHDIARQAGQALAVAHGQGIIHRDLKPSNVFVVDGQAKVIDFGLAADLAAGQPSLLGIATGTIRYMSPEQQRGAPVDERTDLYALATIFYEMLTGRHPDEGTYQPLSALLPGIDPALDVVVERAREPRPDDRYPDLHTFLAELDEVVPTQPASRRAAPWRRALALLQAGITRATGDYWYLTLAVGLVVGFLLPYLLPYGTARVASRFLGLATWDVFFLNLLARWYTLSLARRGGYATLAAYGPLLGTFMGLATAAIVWSTLRLADVDYGGEVEWVEFAVAHILHGFMGLVVGALGYLSLASLARLAQRLRLGPRTGLLLAAAAIALLLTLLFWLLSSIGWGT